MLEITLDALRTRGVCVCVCARACVCVCVRETLTLLTTRRQTHSPTQRRRTRRSRRGEEGGKEIWSSFSSSSKIFNSKNPSPSVKQSGTSLKTCTFWDFHFSSPHWKLYELINFLHHSNKAYLMDLNLIGYMMCLWLSSSRVLGGYPIWW